MKSSQILGVAVSNSPESLKAALLPTPPSSSSAVPPGEFPSLTQGSRWSLTSLLTCSWTIQARNVENVVAAIFILLKFPSTKCLNNREIERSATHDTGRHSIGSLTLAQQKSLNRCEGDYNNRPSIQVDALGCLE